MIHPIRAWNAFFFGPVSARPLGVVRILFGLVALYNLALCAVEIDYWYSGEGLLRGDESWVIAGLFQPSILQFYQDPITVRILFAVTALTAVFLTIGWRSRLMSILFYLGMLMIHNRNLVSSSGADVLLLVFAFNLMLSPCGAAYSVDSWLASRKRGTQAEPIIIPWALRLIQIQISLVYTMAAVLKCGGDLWLNGSALHYVINNTEVTRFDLSFLSQYPVLINLMTYMALGMEFSLAFFLWFKAARPLIIVIGIMLHAGITVTINIPIFAELMWIGYIAFLTPGELDAALRALDVRRLFRPERSGVEVESRREPEPSPKPLPSFSHASIVVRPDGAHGLLGPHRIDVAPARSVEEASILK